MKFFHRIHDILYPRVKKKIALTYLSEITLSNYDIFHPRIKTNSALTYLSEIAF